MFNNKMKIIVLIIGIALTMLPFSNLLAAGYFYTINKTNYNESLESSISTETNAPVQPEFNFQSAAQVLIEPTTGKVIYANNENERLLPASVTKVMTLLLIMEQIDSGKLNYTDTLTCSAQASKLGGSQIWFKEGETLSIDEALKCITVASANDVTYAMAELIAGTEQNFVKMMNDKAKSLGMNNTNFMNSHGLDEENHYTSAYDIALMSRELIINHPNILNYTKIWMDSIRGGTFELTNTNKLIRFYDGMLGLKTGSTSSAGFNLSGLAKKNDSMFLAVVMKGPSSDIRNEEVKQLLNYAFSNYEVSQIYKRDVEIDKLSINKNVTEKFSVVLKNDITRLVSKGEKLDVIEEKVYNENIVAPIKANTVIGKMNIIDKKTNEVIGQSDIIVKDDVSKSNFKEYTQEFVNRYILRQEQEKI